MWAKSLFMVKQISIPVCGGGLLMLKADTKSTVRREEAKKQRRFSVSILLILP